MKIIISQLREIIREESAASKAAKKAGLVHLGFGRYGPKKGDKATHQSKDGKLVSVGDDMGGGEPKEKPKEKRPGGKQAEDDYHKADQMMTKYAGRDIPKAKYWAKKKKQAADDMMGRTGNELNQETLMIDGKQYRRINESVKQKPKPKYEFSEFYKRIKNRSI